VGTTPFVGLVLWLSARAVGSFEEALLAAFMRAQDDRDDLAVTVSEREAALASTEATQRASLESLEQGVAVSDLSGAVLLLNRAGRRLLGYEADELGELFRTGRWETYREDGTVLPPDERPLGITMRTGDAVRGALVRWRARSGELRLLRVSTEPLHDDDGGLRGVVTAFADITDAREAELRLKASEARFAALVERSSDVICVVDEQTHLRYVSPAGERLFGALVTASGRPFHALLHPEDRGPVTAAFRDLLDDPGGNRTVSFRVLTAHGRWCPVEVVATNRLHDPAVQGVVANLRDVSERAEAEERLRHLAFHDLLTGLPNRSLLLQRLDDAVESAAQGWAKPALLFVDLDRFKAVNDTFGHASGDLLLQRVAERIATCIGSGDTLARIGGDEFVVLVDDASQLGDTTELAARIIRSVEEPVELPNGVATVSASIGIAVDFDHDAEALLRRADTALYRAKAAGGRTSTVAAGDDDHDLPDAPPRRRRLSVAS
jgi:diguanylate cyclase (GGDEF)-like protein/PAS domain S-box-containing protein